MEESGAFIRKLNARERRRLNVHRMLPADTIDPACPTQDIVKQHQTTLLYRYGCSLAEMKLEIEDDSEKKKRKKSFLIQLRGFFHLLLDDVIQLTFRYH